jgi:hypothetical protein
MTATLPTAPSRTPTTAPGGEVLALLDQACRTLHLPTIRSRYEEVAAIALREQASCKAFLLDLLDAECEHRDERRKPLGPRSPVSPRETVDDFDFTANPNVTPEVINTLTSPGMSRFREAALLDRGLRHREQSPADRGTEVAEAGMKVRYTTTANLINELAEAADERQLTRVLNRYSKIDLLCLDELPRAGQCRAKCCSRFFTDREGRSAVAVASNARSPNGAKPSVTSGSAPRSSTS